MASRDKIGERFESRQERRRMENLGRRKQDEDQEEPAPAEQPVEQAHTARTAGRNDPCPCGSGKKYKKCCGATK